MKNKKQILTQLTILLTIISSFSQNVTISNGANIVTSGAVTIDYGGGTLINNGNFNMTNGTLKFSAPVLFANGSGTTNINNLNVAHSGTSVLNNKINVFGSLLLSNGTLNANNNLTLKSNANGSAVIAPIPSGSTLTGKITVERYIPQGKRAFRFLTPSVTTDNYINNNWQLATHITGSVTGTSGFDITTSGNPSMFTYINQQTTGSGWEAISNTDNTNLNALQGYRILIRGDRTPTLISQTSQANMNIPVTLSATGVITSGTVTFNSNSLPIALNNTSNPNTDGYSLIGNPYVNTINWNTLTKTNLTDAYYAWDANMGTNSERGRYVVYSSSTGSNTVTSAINEYIQPGQAFFIKNTILATPSSLTFNESDKLGTNSTSNFYRTTPSEYTRLELQVYQSSELALGSYPIDAAVTVFGAPFTNAVETGDVLKLSTGIENLSFFNNGQALVIDARSQISNTDELLVQLQQFKANKSYTFKTLFTNLNDAATPFLLDTYLNQYIPLATNSGTFTTFITTNDALSYATNRFKIVFQNTVLHQENFSSEQIVVYPNPVTNNQFNIVLPKSITGEVEIKIINTIGQTVYTTTTEAQNNINIEPKDILSQGIYFVTLLNQGKISTKKITIQ